MTPEETLASFRVLLAVAHADGVVCDTERASLKALREAFFPRSPEGADPRSPRVDLDAELDRIRSPEARRLTMMGALAVACIDGRCSAEEHALLERIRARFALEDTPALAVEEGTWLSQAADVAAVIAQKTDDFLHEMARASAGDDLSQLAYESLVHKLEQEKVRVVRRAIDAVAGKVP